MDSTELLRRIIKDLPVRSIHPLHVEILAECCENVIAQAETTDYVELKQIVYLWFLTTDATLKGTLRACLKVSEADGVNVNYRNQQFLLQKGSAFLTRD